MEEKQNKDKIHRTIITKNVLRQGELLGIPKRNIIEAVIAAVFFFFIMIVIPFNEIVRNVVLIVFGIPLFILFIHGIKNRSVSEIFFGELRYLKKRRVLHLRGPEYVRQAGQTAGGSETNKTDFQGFLELAKRKVKDFIDEYSD